MVILELVEKLINEHGSASVLRDHLDLIRHKAQELEAENGKLREENARLIERTTGLENELKSKALKSEFVEHRGALFKRKQNGGFHEAVYCPECQRPMSSVGGELPYRCKCGVTVDFTGRRLAKVLGELV